MVAMGCWLAVSAGIGPASAESGSFFKNLFGNGGGSETSPSLTTPKAMDPEDAYCPEVDIADGGSVLRTFAGSAGDGSRLHHQIGFGQLGRECAVRSDGSVSVKVGAQVRALLGPTGKPGRFDIPVTIALKFNDQVLAARSRRVAIQVPDGAAQGTVSVIENDLIVPPAKAVGYDIVVSLAGPAARDPGPGRSAKPKRPSGPPSAESATGDGTGR